MNSLKNFIRTLGALILLLATPALKAADPTWVNNSDYQFTIQVVADPQTKGMIVFTPGGTLKAPGDTIVWTRGMTMTAKYSGIPNLAHIRFRLVDAAGRWGEFVADNPLVGSPKVTFLPTRQSPDTDIPKDDADNALYNTTRSPGGLLLGRNLRLWPMKTDGNF